MFPLISKFHPLGVVSPYPKAIFMYKSWKNVYKIRLQRDFFYTCTKWPKWQEISVDIKILSPDFVPQSAPDLRLYTFIKSWKNVYKVRGWRDTFETCHTWPKWWGLPVDIEIFAPYVVSFPGAIYTCMKQNEISYKIMRQKDLSGTGTKWWE